MNQKLLKEMDKKICNPIFSVSEFAGSSFFVKTDLPANIVPFGVMFIVLCILSPF